MAGCNVHLHLDLPEVTENLQQQKGLDLREAQGLRGDTWAGLGQGFFDVELAGFGGISMLRGVSAKVMGSV